jgi:hypothetical protein
MNNPVEATKAAGRQKYDKVRLPYLKTRLYFQKFFVPLHSENISNDYIINIL